MVALNSQYTLTIEILWNLVIKSGPSIHLENTSWFDFKGFSQKKSFSER